MIRIRHKTSFNNNMTCNDFGIQRITSLKEMKTFFVPSVVGQATGGLTSVVQTNMLEGMDECRHFKLGKLLKGSILEGSEVRIPILPMRNPYGDYPTNQTIYLQGHIAQGSLYHHMNIFVALNIFKDLCSAFCFLRFVLSFFKALNFLRFGLTFFNIVKSYKTRYL